MWEERERRAQRMRVCVFVLGVSILFAEWWASDSRSMSFASRIDALFHDSPQSRPASTPSGEAALPPSTRRSDQPASVGTTGGANGGSGGFTRSPDSRVDPITHSDPPVVTRPSHDPAPEERTPPKDTRQASPPVPCDTREDAARVPTDTQRTLPKDAVPCEDRSRDQVKDPARDTTPRR